MINQKPEIIWDVLTRGAAYPEWDPYCDKIEGEIELGGRLKVFSKLSPERAFSVTVTQFIPYARITWSSGMPFGLFKGERKFTLNPKNGQVEFTLSEEFSGLLLGLIGKTIPDMNDAFDAFTDGLKQRAELFK